MKGNRIWLVFFTLCLLAGSGCLRWSRKPAAVDVSGQYWFSNTNGTSTSRHLFPNLWIQEATVVEFEQGAQLQYKIQTVDRGKVSESLPLEKAKVGRKEIRWKTRSRVEPFLPGIAWETHRTRLEKMSDGTLMLQTQKREFGLVGFFIPYREVIRHQLRLPPLPPGLQSQVP
jgi:hypothetical protein